MTPDQVKKYIETGLPGAVAYVSGDGHHFYAVVVAESFSNKNMLEQHRMVYDAIGPQMSGIHALSMRTFTKQQWDNAGRPTP